MEEGIFMMVFGFIGVVMLIVFAIALLAVIGQWRCFTKAGKPGWAALVPFYNQWVNCEIVGVNPYWVLIVLIGSLISGLIPVIGSLLSMAVSVYFMIILYVSTARSFGKDDSYAIGLYFLAPIFWFLLGRENVNYVGPTPMKDYVMDFVNENILGKSSTSTTSTTTTTSSTTTSGSAATSDSNTVTVKYCSGCGFKIENNDKFCPSCGKEL